MLLYRKPAEAMTGLTERAEVEERIEQLERVDDFIGRWCRGRWRDRERRIASFSTTGEFEDRV